MRLPEEIKIEEPDETEADTVEAEPSHSEIKKCKTVLRDHQKVKKSNRGPHMLYVDTERVISEVRRRPALWDLCHSLYKDRDARQGNWKGIYETLYPDFKHMRDADRREIEKIVQQRWKTARDAYIRDKNVLRGGGRKKVYMYFDELRFLDKVHDKEEDSNNTATRHLPDEMDAISIDTPNIETFYCTPPTSTSNRDMEVQMNSSETGDSSHNTSDLYKKPKNLRKRKHSDSDFVKQIMTMFKDNVKLLKNEDLSFFMSLLPLMEQFSLHQKLIFRSEVLKKAMEIANLRNPYENNGDDSSRSCKLGISDAASPKGKPVVSKDSTSTSVSRNYESPAQSK